MKWSVVCVFLLGAVLPTDGKRFHVDLHNHGLTKVPTNISTSTQTLDLSFNLLTTIPNDSFVTLKSLIILDLGHNELQSLEASAFSGLSELISLDLSYNRLLLNYKAYPVPIFQPLRKLKSLLLIGNMHNAPFPDKAEIKEYPEKIFAYVKTLKTLSIDGLKDVRFGSGFLRMSQLTSVYAYYGNLGTVLKLQTIAVFLNLTIESLTLDCNTIEAGIFKPFKDLRSITVRTFSFSKALGLLVGLEGRNISSLAIRGSNRGHRGAFIPQNYVLTKNNAAHLAAMCVAHLNLNNNFIIHVDVDIFRAFQHTECLETFEIEHNFLNVATHFFTLLSLARFPNLKYINVSPARPFSRRKRQGLHAISPDTKLHSKSLTRRHYPANLSLLLPPSLEVMNLSYSGSKNPRVPDINFMNGQHLRILDVAYFGLNDCSFQLLGLPNLTVLNISGFDCSSTALKLLNNFPKLEVLSACNCRLAESFEHDTKGSSFSSLSRLRLLDLSDNNLITIPKGLFQPLLSLEVLILANNKLYQTPQAVFNLMSLTRLNLSSNVLVSLTKEDVHHLTKIYTDKKRPLTLSLSHNPLICTCKTLPFLRWFFTTNIYIAGNRSLKCTLKNGTVTKILNLKSEIKNMEVECVSRIWLVVSIVGCSLLIVSLVLGIFGYRYRFNIKYWFLTKCRKAPGYEELPKEQYQYDAFVAYHYQNYQWACIVLRRVLETENHYVLCLHDRDFAVGVSIQQNIVDAVNNSRKVILVISRAYLTSDWCEFEIQMAGMRMVRDGRDGAIIVIMMEEIPVAEMPRSLLNLWKNITFLLWTNDPIDEQIFWDRLLEVMARP